MSRSSRFFLSFLAGLVLFLSPALTKADPLVLSVTNSSQTAVPGGSVTFFAILTNTGGTSTQTDTISGRLVNLTSLSAPPVAGDPSPFFANFLNQSVPSGSSLGPLAFVTFTFPANTPVGTTFFSTTDVFVYFNTPGLLLFTNDVSLNVQIVAPTAPVPEPTTMLLVASGLAGIAVKVRKRRKGCNPLNESAHIKRSI